MYENEYTLRFFFCLSRSRTELSLIPRCTLFYLFVFVSYEINGNVRREMALVFQSSCNKVGRLKTTNIYPIIDQEAGLMGLVPSVEFVPASLLVSDGQQQCLVSWLVAASLQSLLLLSHSSLSCLYAYIFLCPFSSYKITSH